ncbi:uncharacterized protein LOC131044948 isoform X2 [Cryptomeria japonica]|uniref:uncharacterized protein LOC131044948 isoform X2 n=1 Tax=Cryptomeria japonica TaxID=3369 RepID=UPI0027DA1802|nr:uncharacterized protein LOC131044948 isoform X2 [Cryptomeria japonica]
MGSRTSLIILREIFPQIDERIIKAVTLEHGNDIDSALEFILNEVVPKQNSQIVTEKFDKNCVNIDPLPTETDTRIDLEQQPRDDGTSELFDEIILPGKNPIEFAGAFAGSSSSVNLLAEEKAYNEVKMRDLEQFYGEICNGESSLSGEYDISHSRGEIENMGSSFQVTGMQFSKKNSGDIEDSGVGEFCFKEETDEINSKGIRPGLSLLTGMDLSKNNSDFSKKNSGDIEDSNSCNLSFKEETNEINSKGLSSGLSLSLITGTQFSKRNLVDAADSSSGNTSFNEETNEMNLKGIRSRLNLITGMHFSNKNSSDIEDSSCGNFSFKEETDEISSKGVRAGFSLICDSETSTGQLACRSIANAANPEGENQSMQETLVGGISFLPAYNETINCLDAKSIIPVSDCDCLEKEFMDNFHISQSVGDNIDYLSVCNKENSIYMELDARDSYSSAQSSVLSSNSSSCQMVDTDSVEGVVSEARKNKEALMEGMESIRSLWTKMQLEEAAARRAKEEAAKGGMEVFAKVEELRKTLARAKETNDMHSGEVYGERAILATEARELRSRIAQLTAEKDSALCMIDEMCRVLQARYSAARKEREAALEEKMKKEETARRALALEELMMAKVAQDSRGLELEAETNTKLREFLINQGDCVDALQGELSVLYQDVKVLKEQIDSGNASGFLNIRLAASPRFEDVNRHYKSLDKLGDSTNFDVSIASEHQLDCKSFGGNDDINVSGFGMLYSSHELRDTQIESNGVCDSIEDMKTLTPVASCGQLSNSAPNTVILSTDRLLHHLAVGGEKSTDEEDMVCNHRSLENSRYSGDTRKEQSFEQLSDEDGWQMLDT